MIFRSAFLLLPVAMLAQTGAPNPPPEVDQALRARVTEFFNYHVEGATGFRKAMELVADDTKDYYFSAQKIQFKSFKIDSITYSDHFTKAVVTLSGRRMFRVSPQFPETEIAQPMSTMWKIENNKWCWYRDASAETSLTPMGPSDPKVIGSGGGMVPRDFSQGAMDKRAQEVLKQSKVSKTEVTLAAGHPSSEQVVFHNGQPGSVLLSVDISPNVAGFSAVLDKTNINAGEDVGLKIHYDPAAGKHGAPSPVTVRVIVAPFNQAFPITVKFASE